MEAIDVIKHAYDLFESWESVSKWLQSTPSVIKQDKYKCCDCNRFYTIGELLDLGNKDFIQDVDTWLSRAEWGIPS